MVKNEILRRESMKRIEDKVLNSTVTLSIGDVTAGDQDALVFPEFTIGASYDGVGRAVIARGGMPGLKDYDKEIAAHGRRKLGTVFHSAAGKMQIPNLIHATSVILWNDPEMKVAKEIQYSVIQTTFFEALKKAEEKGYKRLASPLLGTGAMGTLTPAQSAEAMLSALAQYEQAGGRPLHIDFVVWDGERPEKIERYFSEFSRVLQTKSYLTAPKTQRSQGEIASEEERAARDARVDKLRGPRTVQENLLFGFYRKPN